MLVALVLVEVEEIVLVEERVLLEVEVMVVLAMAQLHNTHCIRWRHYIMRDERTDSHIHFLGGFK